MRVSCTALEACRVWGALAGLAPGERRTIFAAALGAPDGAGDRKEAWENLQAIVEAFVRDTKKRLIWLSRPRWPEEFLHAEIMLSAT